MAKSSKVQTGNWSECRLVSLPCIHLFGFHHSAVLTVDDDLRDRSLHFVGVEREDDTGGEGVL